jgi:hypothetical protein
MEISNKDRFPHYTELMKLGRYTDEARWYNQVHSDMLNKEYEFIMQTVEIRHKFGDNKKIHNGSIEQS